MQEQAKQGTGAPDAAQTAEELRVPVRGRPGEYILYRITFIEDEDVAAARQHATGAELDEEA